MAFWWIPWAWALSSEEAGEAAYLSTTEQWAALARLTAPALSAEPPDPEAARWWVRAQQGLGRTAAVDTLLRGWAAGGDELARMTLAWHLTRGAGQPPCDEALPLLEPLPAEPGRRWWALRTQLVVHQRCDLDATAVAAALAASAGDDPLRQLYLATLAWERGELPPETLALARVIHDSHPEHFGEFARVWKLEDRPPVAAARRELGRLAAAQAAAAVQDGDPVRLHAAWQVLRKADPELARAEAAHLGQLDPIGFPERRSPSDDLLRVRDAREAGGYREEFAALQALAEELPAQGEARAVLDTRRATVAEALGEAALALDFRFSAAAALPTNLQAQLHLGEAALRLGDRQREASEALSRTLAAWPLRSLPPAGGQDPSPEAALERTRRERARLRLLLGRLSLALGEGEAAIAHLTEAWHLGGVAEAPLALGLALEASGRPVEAVDLLADGLALAPSSELVPAAQEALARCWTQDGAWHPGGLSAWLASRPPPTLERPAASGAAEQDPRSHPLVGSPFPLRTVRLGEAEINLADLPGPLVVDLWATWCGPCRDAMPSLDELARRWAGRARLIGVSVDRNEREVRRFLRQQDPVGYPLAWSGPDALRLLGVKGIPAAFVLDQDHRVTAVVTGYYPGDQRLDRLLEALASP